MCSFILFQKSLKLQKKVQLYKDTHNTKKKTKTPPIYITQNTFLLLISMQNSAPDLPL